MVTPLCKAKAVVILSSKLTLTTHAFVEPGNESPDDKRVWSDALSLTMVSVQFSAGSLRLFIEFPVDVCQHKPTGGSSNFDNEAVDDMVVAAQLQLFLIIVLFPTLEWA
eukprot:jgi/Picre1/33916/NNA_001395.t1